MPAAAPASIALLMIATAASAQDAGGPVAIDPALVKVAAAVEAFVASEQVDEKLLDAAVAAVLAHDTIALPWLGERLEPARRTPAEPRSKGLLTLATRVAIDFIHRERTSEVAFAGQYAPLGALQPFVGKLLFRLLLDTPDWFPTTQRAELVPALLDLQPTSAGDEVAAVLALANRDEIEPRDLREALAALLWRWGLKDTAKKHLDRFRQECSEGDAEDRVLAHEQLAQFQYALREYRDAAATWRAVVALADRSAVELTPRTLYSATCGEALAGELERAMRMFERVAARNGSPDLDSSLRLPRRLFERDPEIATLRADVRFAALLERASAQEPKAPDTGRGR